MKDRSSWGQPLVNKGWGSQMIQIQEQAFGDLSGSATPFLRVIVLRFLVFLFF
jgi:hypothetical protein